MPDIDIELGDISSQSASPDGMDPYQVGPLTVDALVVRSFRAALAKQPGK